MSKKKKKKKPGKVVVIVQAPVYSQSHRTCLLRLAEYERDENNPNIIFKDANFQGIAEIVK